MKRPTDLYSFVYRGMLADEAIRRVMPAKVESTSEPEADIRQRMPLELFEDAELLGPKKMAWVYIAIATFESNVRTFIEERLLEKIGPTWADTAITGDIKRQANRRREDEEQIRWHGSRGSSPLAYVQLGDLALIIQNQHAHFKELIPSVEWAREIFRTLERSRNVIMHSGQLKMADVERVAMNIRDWMRQVGG
jgi:hypothetical protein